MAAFADLAVEKGHKVSLRYLPRKPTIAAASNRLSHVPNNGKSISELHQDMFRRQDTAGPDPPTVTSTISGGTPRRSGMMLQPRPPETMTSQLIRVWP